VPIVISLAELSLLFSLTWLTRSSLLHPEESKEDRKNRQKSIVGFGARSIPAVFLLDMNTRIDVLILSLLKGAEVVGQYTIASTFSEGLFQMAMVTRLVIDPRIAGLNAAGLTKDLMQFLKRHIAMTYLVMIPVITISIFLYSPAVDLLFSKENASGSQEIFIYLALGVLLASGFIPLTNLLNQLGDPLGQSLLLSCVTGINILGNLILIPSMGGAGAALATALSQAIFVPLLILFVKTRRGQIFNLESK
jgi:PST family polysaccharide transporter